MQRAAPHNTAPRWAAPFARMRRYITLKFAVSAATGVGVGVTLNLLGVDLPAVFGLLALCRRPGRSPQRAGGTQRRHRSRPHTIANNVTSHALVAQCWRVCVHNRPTVRVMNTPRRACRSADW